MWSPRLRVWRHVSTNDGIGGVPCWWKSHSDGSGSELLNAQLSAARAEAIAELLVQHGVDAERVHARGIGETRPLAVEQRTGGRAATKRERATAASTSCSAIVDR